MAKKAVCETHVTNKVVGGIEDVTEDVVGEAKPVVEHTYEDDSRVG